MQACVYVNLVSVSIFQVNVTFHFFTNQNLTYSLCKMLGTIAEIQVVVPVA